MTAKNKIHFVGSIGLENAEQVFRTLAETVGDRASRYPDGETGVRTDWIGWQAGLIFENPGLEPSPDDPGFMLNDIAVPPKCRIVPTTSVSDLRFGNLGYADAAIESYAVFKKLKSEGTIPAETRLQVSLPTPRAVIETFVVPEEADIVEPVYTAAISGEVTRILDAIPHNELAIQWDVCTEIVIHDGGLPSQLDDPLGHTARVLIEFNRSIPDDVEVGIHLCYGDPGHKHIIEPADTSSAVLFANTLVSESPRKIQFLHLPVPKDRSDDEYFAPLEQLEIGDTELALGLVHMTDGTAGTALRMAVADKYVSNYSVATECGFGRRPSETIPELLRLHAEVVSNQ